MTLAIETPRLSLVTLVPEVLAHVASGDLDRASHAFGLRLPIEVATGIPAALRLEQLRRDPSELPWLLRAIILREIPTVIGHIGFHSRPDPSGRVEVGYEIAVAHRGRGYAREAVISLTDWAFHTGHATRCVASVAPTNRASLSLVRGLGFSQAGEHIDEIDGLELVFERSLPIST